MDEQFESWEGAVRWLREQPEKSQLVLDCYYDDPLKQSADRYYQSEEWAAIRSYLPGLGRALDVGAGRGIASYALAKEGHQVTALEPDPSPLVGAEAIRALAREASLDITVAESFSEELEFPDGHFDVIFARAVLHHTRDLSRACREFARVLKPGGTFLAVREHVISKKSDLPLFLARHPLHHLYGGENAFLLGEYRAALEGAGLTIATCLGPLESPINFGPQSSEQLRSEILARLPIPLQLRGIAGAALGRPGVWRATRRVLGMVDRRPGRLYSFICTRGLLES